MTERRRPAVSSGREPGRRIAELQSARQRVHTYLRGLLLEVLLTSLFSLVAARHVCRLLEGCRRFGESARGTEMSDDGVERGQWRLQTINKCGRRIVLSSSPSYGESGTKIEIEIDDQRRSQKFSPFWATSKSLYCRIT